MNSSLPNKVNALARGVYENFWTAAQRWQPRPPIGRRSRRCMASPGPSREDLTICFLDLEGFTAFTSREGDETATAVLGEHRRLVERIVRASGGRVVQHVGDGTVLAFDDAAHAVDAALAIVGSDDAALRVRAGLHTGPVTVLADGDVLGHVVNVAARVAEATDGGDVVVTVETAMAAGDNSPMRYMRPQHRRFKGIDELVRTHRLVEHRTAQHLEAA